MLQPNGLSIETDRLRIVPMTHEFISKILTDDISAYELLGATKSESWPEEADIWDVLPMMLEGLASQPNPDGFNGAWVFIDKISGAVVGDGGFKGHPDENGMVDIGFGIAKEYRQKGFGYEAVYALTQWALSQSDVKGLTADCLEGNVPSMKILTKLGLHEHCREDGYIYFKTPRVV